MIRVALFQRVVPEYRVGIFSLLARQPGIQLTIYSGSFAERPAGAICRGAGTIRLGPFRLDLRPLIAMLLHHHDVIICEGRISLLTSVILALVGTTIRRPCIWWTSLHRADGVIAPRGGVAGWLTRLALRCAGAVLTYGTLAAEAARTSGVSPDRIHVACNALDTDRLGEVEKSWRSPPERLAEFQKARDLHGRRVILYVGRLVPQKRALWLIDALDRLRRLPGGADVRLVIMGDGPERTHIVDAARAKHLQEFILFTGEIRDPAESCPYFLSARVLALPGTGGLAINHAMTFGVPVVVSGGDGTERDSIEEGVNGHIVAPPDPEVFTDRLRGVLQAEESKWRKMAEAAGATAKGRINARAMVRSMNEAIHSIAARPPLSKSHG